MQLVGLTGRAKSGKDTVGEYLKNAYGFEAYAYADPLKRAASEMFGIPLDDFYNQSVKEVPNKFWDMTPRYILQILGTEGGRDLFRKDIWTKRAEMEIRNQCDKQATGLVITDVRFENEAKQIRESGGKVVHIYRPDAEDVEAHSSESGVKISNEDAIINNSGTLQDLYTSVDVLMGDV